MAVGADVSSRTIICWMFSIWAGEAQTMIALVRASAWIAIAFTAKPENVSLTKLKSAESSKAVNTAGTPLPSVR